MNKCSAIYQTDFGAFEISHSEGKIISLCFVDSLSEDLYASSIVNDKSDLTEKAFLQLQEYFRGQRRSFDLPLAPHGTEFQKKVWRELCNIPYSQTRTYKEIAQAIGHPNAARAVGMANNRNPIPIVIPCHRVVGANGSLVGYAYGLEIKKKLLTLEIVS